MDDYERRHYELTAVFAAREREQEAAAFMADAATWVEDRTLVGGARETAGLVDGASYHRQREGVREVDWTEPGLYVTRLRLLSDPGFPVWDVSYCDGEIGDEMVAVRLPFHQLPKRGWKHAIVEEAIRAGVHAKRLGILENVSTLQ